jgi:HTH-type transcriptional regulator/antitoxin MqsA
MKINKLCPICGEGCATAQTELVESEYKGNKQPLELHFLQCNTCHSEFATAAESKLNKRIVIAFRKSIDGLLSGKEIEELRKKYKLNQTQAAKLFGGGPVAFSKYENNDVAQSGAMDTLLRLILKSETAFWQLVEVKNMTNEIKRNDISKNYTQLNSSTIKLNIKASFLELIPISQRLQFSI